MNMELVVKIGIISALLFAIWLIYNSGKKKVDYMEQLLSETQKVKGQYDK